MKSSAILRPNYFSCVWKSSAILRLIYLNYVEIFRNLPFCLPRYTLKSSAILRSISQNYGMKFSVNIFRSIYQSYIEICHNLPFKFPEVFLKFSAIFRPNYFRYVWKSSAILRSIYLNYVETFLNLLFCLPRYTLKSSAILHSIPKPMALNLPLTFSVQFTKAILRSSAIFRSVYPGIL